MSNRCDKENLNKHKQNSHTLLKLNSIRIFQSIKNLKVQIQLYCFDIPMQTIYHDNAIVHHVFLG